MLEFSVEDMTCGHCVATITNAVKAVDAQATVDADVKNHIVRVGGTSDAAHGQAIENAIRDAGYTPKLRG